MSQPALHPPLQGQIVHDCDAQWRDEDGAPLTAGGQALFLGQRDTALGPGFILELDTKEEIPIVGLQWRSEPFVVAARAREDGFWLVVRGPVEGPGQRARWHVAFDGSATNEGDYPSLPINVKEPSFGKLDGAGRLIESASYEATDGLGSAIVRRSLDGDSEILNRSKSAFFGLVTGP